MQTILSFDPLQEMRLPTNIYLTPMFKMVSKLMEKRVRYKIKALFLNIYYIRHFT